MAKHHGLSQLADVAKKLTQPRDAHYPIRRRGQKRQLNPNWTAIAWLEADTLQAAEIELISGENEDGLVGLRALGWYQATRSGTSYCRPMIQLLRAETTSATSARQWMRGCPDCDNFAYTTRCTRHDDTEFVPSASNVLAMWETTVREYFTTIITFEEAPNGQN